MVRRIGFALALIVPFCVASPASGRTAQAEGFVRIGAGTFRMGSTEREPGRLDDEAPHRVRVSRAFLMRATEVTQHQWQELMGNAPSAFAECGGDCPVENVTWFDAVAYANAASRRDRLPECYDLGSCDGAPGTPDWKCVFVQSRGPACTGYRLPTEAEWEHAAGLAPGSLDGAAWYEANSDARTHEVGRKRPNAAGLHDLAGNVGEWCGDWHDPQPLRDATDPAGPPSGSYRIVHGGSFASGPAHLRPGARAWAPPDQRSPQIGFRLVRTLAR